MKNTTRGFTLIELLVVIAIIGILSSIVMASLNTARAKGADASIKANMAQLRSQAELYHDDNNNYGDDTASCANATTFFGAGGALNIVTEAERVSGGTATCYADDGDAAAGSEATTWAVSVPLKTDNTISWCVDSAGTAATGTADLVADEATCT